MKIDFQRTAKFHFICMNLGKLFTNQFVSSFSKEECNSLNKFHFCNFRQNRSITERVIVRFYLPVFQLLSMHQEPEASSSLILIHIFSLQKRQHNEIRYTVRVFMKVDTYISFLHEFYIRVQPYIVLVNSDEKEPMKCFCLTSLFQLNIFYRRIPYICGCTH